MHPLCHAMNSATKIVNNEAVLCSHEVCVKFFDRLTPRWRFSAASLLLILHDNIRKPLLRQPWEM
jgi:hypothetical protein